MATIEEQAEMGNLLRRVNDAHYQLYLALFKLQTTANYFDVIPEEQFAGVESTLAEVEDALQKVRTVMAYYKRPLACHSSLRSE